jgi:hypothetical protein
VNWQAPRRRPAGRGERGSTYRQCPRLLQRAVIKTQQLPHGDRRSAAAGGQRPSGGSTGPARRRGPCTPCGSPSLKLYRAPAGIAMADGGESGLLGGVATNVKAAVVAAVSVSWRPPLGSHARYRCVFAHWRSLTGWFVQGALAVSTVAGGGGAAGDGENGISPQGNFLHMLDSEEQPLTRPELMDAALQTLQESRDAQASSSPRSPGSKQDRTAWANDTWLKMYAIMDYVRCTFAVRLRRTVPGAHSLRFTVGVRMPCRITITCCTRTRLSRASRC